MEEPVRVLQIVTAMNRGGIETMLMNYYLHMNRKKVQFDFLQHTQDHTDYDDEIRGLGGKIFSAGRLNPFSLAYRKGLERFFSEHPEYKIAHCHMSKMSSFPLIYAKKAGIPTRIAHAHTANSRPDLKNIIKDYYGLRMNQVTTDRFACGQEAGRFVYGKKSFQIVDNAIDAEAFRFDERKRIAVRKSIGADKRTIVLGHVGRFFEEKNHTFLLELFKELTDNSNDDYLLLLVGEGPLKKQMEVKAHSLGLNDKVVFYGLSDDVMSMMSAMDIFVMPSLFEGLPVTLIEAQANGLPCVISDTITEEAVFSQDVKTCSLHEDMKLWVKQINNTVKSKSLSSDDITGYRVSGVKMVKDAGYDIEDNARKLQEFYLSRA